MLRDMCRSFADNELAPNAGEWDKNHTFPKDQVRPLFFFFFFFDRMTMAMLLLPANTANPARFWAFAVRTVHHTAVSGGAREACDMYADQLSVFIEHPTTRSMTKNNHDFPPKQVAQLGELGLMGVAIGEEDGGTGLDYLVSDDACLPLPFVMIEVVECVSPTGFSNFARPVLRWNLFPYIWRFKKIIRRMLHVQKRLFRRH